MPGIGIGGMISDLANPALNDQIGAAITPNPNPLAQQGQPAATSGSPTMPNAAATKMDPVSANLASLLLKRQQQAEAAQGINQGLDRMAASFGTAQQQASKMAALRGGGGAPGGNIGDVGDIMKIQQEVADQNDRARFMANVSVFAQTLRDHGINVTDPQAGELMNSPKFMDTLAGAFGSNVTQTGTVKDADAATAAWAAANPNATEQQKADYKSNLIAGGMGGNDLEQRQYLQEKNAGLTTDDYATWKGKKAAEAAGAVTETKNVKEFRDNATADYTPLNSKLMSVQTALDILNKDPAAAQAALQSFQPTTGKWAAIDVFQSQKVKDAAAALQKVQSSLSADQLAGTKNVRNQREFATLGQAANAGLQAASSPDDFKKGLDDITNKFLDAQATLELTVGHRLTGKLVGHGNQDLLDSKNPYFQGGSQENDFRKMSDAEAENAFKQLPKGARYVGPDGVARTK